MRGTGNGRGALYDSTKVLITRRNAEQLATQLREVLLYSSLRIVAWDDFQAQILANLNRHMDIKLAVVTDDPPVPLSSCGQTSEEKDGERALAIAEGLAIQMERTIISRFGNPLLVPRCRPALASDSPLNLGQLYETRYEDRQPDDPFNPHERLVNPLYVKVYNN